MPKVSEAHLAARREQILNAATVCFGNDGFHATSMADVIAASGLSAGAVYRYFTGKEQLVEAIADRALGAAGDAVAELLAEDPAPDLVLALTRVIGALDQAAARGPVDLRRIAVQAWAEALRSPEIMVTARGAQERARGYFTELATRAQVAGTLPEDADPRGVARVLQAIVVGRVVVHLLLDEGSTDGFGDGLTALLGHPAAPAPASRTRRARPGPAAPPPD